MNKQLRDVGMNPNGLKSFYQTNIKPILAYGMVFLSKFNRIKQER